MWFLSSDCTLPDIPPHRKQMALNGEILGHSHSDCSDYASAFKGKSSSLPERWTKDWSPFLHLLLNLNFHWGLTDGRNNSFWQSGSQIWPRRCTDLSDTWKPFSEGLVDFVLKMLYSSGSRQLLLAPCNEYRKWKDSGNRISCNPARKGDGSKENKAC